MDEKLQGRKADRILMYNPDAIAQWIYEKYPNFLQEVTDNTELNLPLCTVMPSVTPVCFGTMYTGAQPAVHGIRKYEKPVVRTDTVFDALIRAGFCQFIPETTKIIIAQRVASVQDADLILVMDNGTVAAAGTHDELLKTSEIYREVHEQQTNGGEADE